MSIAYYLSALILAATPLALAAQAQSSGGPTDIAAAVTTYEYRSAFQDYRAMADESEAPAKVWRAANDEVGRIGGHAGYMKSAQGTEGSASASKDSTADWLPFTPHSGHGGHHGSHH
jgi:hypothetical protein